MNNLIVTPSAEKKIRSGQLLLEEKDFLHLTMPDQLITLSTKAGDVIGTAYLSPQHKGVGWVLSREQIQLNKGFFLHLFKQAKAKRHAFHQSPDTTAYRLFNQDGDFFGGLSIDCYGDFALFSWYNTFVYGLKDMIIDAFRTVFPEYLGGYEKVRVAGLSYESAHVYGQEAPEQFLVLENGVSYSVFMNDGLMTGIFLDQHEVRKQLVTGLAKDKRLLNMFSYTAAFSVAAAVGGARETVSVDLAKRSKELSEAHFRANGLELDAHRFVIMDVFDYFKYAKRHNLQFDVIVLDPPSFARHGKQRFSVAKDYHKLITQSLPLLAPNGIIIASTNAANLSVKRFKQQLEKGFGDRQHKYLSLQQLPSDFTINKNDESSNYLKVFTIRVGL